MSWVKEEFEIPKGYGPAERDAIALEILDYILERTADGRGKGGKAFPGYSESYKNSLDYKIAGKDGKVNLRLSGEMLDSLDIIESKVGKIVIGLPKEDEELNAKAEGNILGSYGGKPNKSRARNFIGLSKEELDGILDKFPLNNTVELMERTRRVLFAEEDAEEVLEAIRFVG
jgi:hypothetical protein